MSFPKVEFEEKYLFSAAVKIMITVIIQNCRKKYIYNINKNIANNSNQHLLNQAIKEKVYWIQDSKLYLQLRFRRF